MAPSCNMQRPGLACRASQPRLVKTASSVMVGLTMPNEAMLDVPIGFDVSVEAVLGRLLEIRTCYAGLGGAWSAPWHGAWCPGRVWRDGCGPAKSTLIWLPGLAHTIPVEVFCFQALSQLSNTALSVPVNCPDCRAGQGGPQLASRHGA